MVVIIETYLGHDEDCGRYDEYIGDDEEILTHKKYHISIIRCYFWLEYVLYVLRFVFFFFLLTASRQGSDMQ